jgi:hypothetical protein
MWLIRFICTIRGHPYPLDCDDHDNGKPVEEWNTGPICTNCRHVFKWRNLWRKNHA